MPRPKIVSFDCASTLLRTDYSPEGFAMKTARRIGAEPSHGAEARYRRLFDEGLTEYVQLNMARDAAGIGAFWHGLTARWASDAGMTGREDELLAAADELLYSPEHRYFDIYDDVVPCLEELRAEGYRMIILSNWDYTLHRVLEGAGLAGYFERIFASLEFGIEKPDPRFFRHAEEVCGATAGDFVHVGDRFDDDVEGAHGADWRAILIDRQGGIFEPPHRVGKLTEVSEALRSIG